MPLSSEKRNPALDVVRCFAFFSVVFIHFFLYSGFYDEIITGWLFWLMIILRTLLLPCVPLFLLLSGYLMIEKKLTRTYYRKLIDTLAVYVLASLCCLLSNVIHSLIAGDNDSPLGYLLIGIFSYTTAPYAWYIEMYIGLFLLIPFLNILYANLRSRREKLGLVATLFVVCALPAAVNIFRFDSLQWWLNPTENSNYHNLLPAFWRFSYPVFYYYVGAYLREYPLKLKKLPCGVLIVLWAVLFGTFQFYRSYGSIFVQGEWQGWSSAYVAAGSILVFHLLSGLDCSQWSEKAKKTAGYLSGLCLGGYLVSAIFDKWFYEILNNSLDTFFDKIFYIPLIVPAVIICSLILSAILNWVYRFLKIRICSVLPILRV